MNEQDLRATFHFLAHKSPVELRIFPKNGYPVVTTADTEQAFIEACKRWDGKAQIYCGLRERRAGFLDDKPKGKGGDAADIVAVTMTVVDVDPIRAEGFGKQPTTDEELAWAFKASEHLTQWHEGRGFLRPARGMSGNGVQLWFPIPRWEVKDGNRTVIPELCRAFEQECRDALPDSLRGKVSIDSIHDLPRIIKVIGTTSVKGDNTPDRPHRVSYWILDSRSPKKIGRQEDEKFLEHLQNAQTRQPELEAQTGFQTPKPNNQRQQTATPKAITQQTSEASQKSEWDWQTCEFLKYCSDNAKTLSEPLWYALASNLCRLGDEGRKLYHQLSSPYSGYSKEETDKKLDHAFEASRPITCKVIAQRGFKCPSLGRCKAKAPAALLNMDTKEEKKKGPSAEEVAKMFLEAQYAQDGVPTLRYFRGDWWTWNGRCYREMLKEDLEARVARFITDIPNCDVTVYFVSSTVKTLTGQCLVPASSAPPVWLKDDFKVQASGHVIAFSNGLLDFDALLRGENVELSAHTPKFFTQIALPYPFDPTAECPEWLAFLNHNLEEDNERIAVLQEFVGYCLCWDVRYHKFLMLEGESHTGKSTFTEVVTALLGEDNVSNVPLEALGQRFALYPTLGKLANITSEIGEIDSVAEGILKAFIAGDRMQFEGKYKPPIMARPTARLIVATNNRPRFLDRSEGIWRRMILVEWNRVIPEAERDRDLRERIKENELPGVFRWTLAGLARLLDQGRFTQARAVEDAIADYRLESNPAREFLVENYEENPAREQYTKKIYKEYVQWCEDSGYRPLSDRKFGKEVQRAFPQAQRCRVRDELGQRCYAYHGIAPKT